MSTILYEIYVKILAISKGVVCGFAMQLVSKLARCSIGEFVFQSGDGLLLPNIRTSLSEDARATTGEFSILDEGFRIGAIFRQISIDQGGILVPSELLQSPQQQNGTAQNLPAGNIPGSPANSSANTTLTPEIRAFLDMTAWCEGADYNVMFTGKTFGSFSDHPRQIQCSNGLCSDAAGRYQFLSTTWDGVRRGLNLSDFSPQSQDLGAVELIRRRGALEDVQRGLSGLNAAIEKCNKEWASFFGSPYGQGTKSLEEMRRVYEAALAKYQGQSSGVPMQPTAATPSVSTPQTVPTVSESSVKGTELIIEMGVGWGLTFKDAISLHLIHTGTISTWDSDGQQITTFSGKSVRWLLTRVPVTQSFEGITFRQYLEDRARQFGLELEMEGDGLKYTHLSQDGQTHLDLILREARRIGFSVKEGTGKDSGKLIVEPTARPKFTGFVIDEEVLVKPARFTDEARSSSAMTPLETVSSPGTGTGEIKTVIDRASGDMTQRAPESMSGTGNAPTGTGMTTGATAPPVGGTVAPTAGSGTAAPTAPATTPVSTQTLSADEQSLIADTSEKIPLETTTRADGAEVITEGENSQKVEPGKITRTRIIRTIVTPEGGSPQPQTQRIETVIAESGRTITTTVSRPGNDDVVTTETSPLTAEDKRLLELSKRRSNAQNTPAAQPGAGLPNQPDGAIDLLDGRAEASAILDESKRVKGYEDSFVLTMNMDTLQLLPSQIVGISGRLFPSAFATEKRVYSVAHDFDQGTTTVSLYVPQAPPPEASGSGVTQFASPSTAATNPGGFIFPVPSGATTIGDGYGTRDGRAPGYRHKILDITAPEGTPAVAMADGTVTEIIPDNGGAGNMMVIQYAGGYESIFMHGMPGFAIVGKGPVKQGQAVFKIGTTGFSSGPHLHLGFNLNGSYCLLSKVGIDVLKMGLPVQRYNSGCDTY